MNEVTLRGLPNNSATKVTPCEPWTFVSKAPPEVMESKQLFSQWRLLPSSEHLVYSGTEGVNAGMRASKQNPIRKLHAIIADFDSNLTDETCATVLERCVIDLRPTWISRSFSGGARLIWVFDEPLPMEVGILTKQFLKVVARELHLGKILPGIDEPAFSDLTKFYDVGRDWKKLGDYTLSANVLNFWLTEASKKTRWEDGDEILIPIEAVAEEVEKQYPGRWDGPFEVGRRGVVFFNMESQNPTAAVVTEAGMICFGEDQLFHPWSKIFGGSFVRKFQMDKIGAAIANVWYDGKAFYKKSSFGVWEPHQKEDFIAMLKVKHGVDAAKDRGEVASEMDRALVYVQEHKRVSGVLPKVFDAQELLYFNGRRFLNCAAVRAMEPAETKQEWGQNFPWLAEFFDTCFDPAPVPCVDRRRAPQPAKTIFFAWLKRFYGSAFAGALTKGQALFLAGGVDRGKTLLSTQIIGRLVGGSSDASDFLNTTSSFNKELLEVGLWQIDDGVASQDPMAHQKFSEMVKRSVANPTFSYHRKYSDAQRVDWFGRVVVTFNDDASSVRIMPNLDQSIEDKLIVLLFAEGTRQFPDWHEMDDTLTNELPFFARWLLDWETPAEIFGNKRFGINSYIQEDLRTKSLHAGGVSDLLELIELWIQRAQPHEKHGDFWQGSASAWMAEVGSDDALKPLIGKFTVKQLGRKFVEAARLRNSKVSVASEEGHGNIYRIALGNGGPTGPAKKAVRFTPEVAD